MLGVVLDFHFFSNWKVVFSFCAFFFFFKRDVVFGFSDWEVVLKLSVFAFSEWGLF